MRTKLITLGLLANTLALTLFLGGLMYAHFFLPAKSGMYVTELDRVGVICEDHLRSYDAFLAENVRGRLGSYIAQDQQRFSVRAVMAGAIVACANMVLLVVLRRSRWQNASSDAPGNA